MSKHIGFRCPDDLWAALEDRSRLTGQGVTTVLVQAIRAGLGAPSTTTTTDTPSATIIERLEALEREVATLKARPRKSPLLNTPEAALNKASNTSFNSPLNTLNLALNAPDGDGWMTVKEAFVRLGGDPDDTTSYVTTKDGRPVKWNSFKQYTRGRANASWADFGLEQAEGQPRYRLIQEPELLA